MVICKKSCTFWIQFIIANKNISSTSNLYLDLLKSSFLQNQDKLRNEPINNALCISEPYMSTELLKRLITNLEYFARNNLTGEFPPKRI